MMANENDEVQQQQNNNDSNNHSRVEQAKAVGDAVVSTDAVPGIHALEAGARFGENMEENKGIQCDEAVLNARGNINDLVADLCLKNRRSSGASYGDYTNIRATLGPLELGVEAASTMSKPEQPSATPTFSGHNFASAAQPPPPQNSSSFSFKHFLNSSVAAPSTTVTALNPIPASSSAGAASLSSSNMVTTSIANSALQTSTGARPKVPQSASSSASLAMGSSATLSTSTTLTTTKMKRSPRFSSFDSQASLAEYANDGSGTEDYSIMGSRQTGGCSGSSGFRLYPDEQMATTSSGAVGSGYERQQHVPRSYSNYDMPLPPASPRRRMNATGTKEAPRPTRLCSSKLKLDLPIDSATTRQPPTGGGNAADFPGAAALPDFVQDHWLDSWYAHEMHLNSPPNSPMRDFVEDITGGSVTAGNSGSGCITTNNVAGNTVGVGGTSDASGTSSKMLPDFLSDGPIIHSSQRLADVAAGLPSNSIGSPDEETPALALHISRLHVENERLQRELADTCTALGEQMRRSNELERQLMQERTHQRNSDVANSAAYSQRSTTQAETNLDKSNRRTIAAQQHVGKLKQQVMQLTTEMDALRRENEILRELGAVGGCNAGLPTSASAPVNCDRPATDGARPGQLGGSRPSRLSRELLLAASNAENNLRQLLLGVNNLRQMAADIDRSESRLNLGDRLSPELYADYVDECEDDYEEYHNQPSGGPAL